MPPKGPIGVGGGQRLAISGVLRVVRAIVREAVVALHGVAVEPDPLLDHAFTIYIVEGPLLRNRFRINHLAVVCLLKDRRWVAISIPRRVRIPGEIPPR